MTKAEFQRSDELVEMSISDIMEKWRPGSHGDDWTWTDEYFDLWCNDGPRTYDIIEQAKEHGIGFADWKAPIQLGNDGRVWNGHHRILVAKYLGIERVMVDIVPPEQKE